MSAMNLLEVKDLSCFFKTSNGISRVINEVSFSIEPGQTLALLGESGSGKSMTAYAISQLLPEAGLIARHSQIKYKGNDLLAICESDMRKIRGNEIAMIFQEPMTSLNPVLTIWQQIYAVLSRRESSKTNCFVKAIELLERVGIPEPSKKLYHYPHQFSGGQLQRVMIALALACGSNLLIADEPTTALDVTIQAQILALIKQFQAEQDMALLFITHDLAVARLMADDVAVMSQGEIVERQTVDGLFTKPKHNYTKTLLDSIPKPKSNSLVSKIEMQEMAVTVSGLSVYFKTSQFFSHQKVKIVDDVSLEIPKAQTLALVGESGSGKTTVAKTLMQLHDNAVIQGDVFLFEQEIMNTKVSKLNEIIQIIFQDPFSSLNPRMSARDILLEGQYGINNKSRFKTAEELMRMVGLSPEQLERYPHQFSGGQRQRLAIARALAVNPKILICDEVTSALDVTVQSQILDLLSTLQQELQLSYLFISHDWSVIAHMADVIAVMKQGKIIEMGKAIQIINSPQEEYTKQLIDAVPKV